MRLHWGAVTGVLLVVLVVFFAFSGFKTSKGAYDMSGSGGSVELKKWDDPDSNVTCYVLIGYQKSGIDCVVR